MRTKGDALKRTLTAEKKQMTESLMLNQQTTQHWGDNHVKRVWTTMRTGGSRAMWAAGTGKRKPTVRKTKGPGRWVEMGVALHSLTRGYKK